jgi:threonine synthase
MSVTGHRPGSSGSTPGAAVPQSLIRCTQCGRGCQGQFFRACSDCRGDIRFDYPERSRRLPKAVSSMWDFADRLPVSNPRNIVTLGEGATALLPANSFPDRTVLWKMESDNPTGSQKDRAVSVAISVAREHGFKRVVTASTGSVGVACAAYSARAGLPCVVLVPNGTPVERLQPMLALGAQVMLLNATFDEIDHILAALDPTRWYQASTIQRRNCYQSEGPKTIAYEILLQMDRCPDWLVVPVGGGGTLFGIWKGFCELHRDGLIDRLPRLLGVQAESFNFLERLGIRPSFDEQEFASLAPDEHVSTILRNLKHGIPPDAHSAMRALHATNGRACSVSDEAALAAQLSLARNEGIFCEPSASVTAAAVVHAIDRDWIASDHSVVGIITGSGFREPAIVSTLEPSRGTVRGEADLEELIAGNLPDQ